MLSLAKKFDFDLSLCHINHNLHPDSEKAKHLCKTFADNNNLLLFTEDIDQACWKNQTNIEARAREKRYIFGICII